MRVLNLPLNLLYPIEVSNSDHEESLKEDNQKNIPSPRKPSVRSSALHARQ